MAKNKKHITYTREPESRGKKTTYAEKFGSFIKTIAQAMAIGCEVIVVAEPWVIGDTYEEMEESLSQLAGTGVGLQITKAAASRKS